MEHPEVRRQGSLPYAIAFQIAAAPLSEWGNLGEEVDIIPSRLPKDALGLPEFPIQLERGEYLALRAGIKSTAGFGL